MSSCAIRYFSPASMSCCKVRGCALRFCVSTCLFAHCVVINNTMLHNATLAQAQGASDMVHNGQSVRLVATMDLPSHNNFVHRYYTW
eukprot:469794-Amphidinium_carterae.2